MIPLPVVGIQEIQVQARPAIPKSIESWIWASQVKDGQTIYLTKNINLKANVSKADMWFAVDDTGTVFINGQKVVSRGGWHEVQPVSVAKLLHPGDNAISIVAANGTGPAGVLFRLEMDKNTIGSDASWRVYDDQPDGWPLVTSQGGANATDEGKPESASWSLDSWPTAREQSLYTCGVLMPADAIVSNVIQVRVDRRKLQIPPKDPNHLIGVQWEPWFLPTNVGWSTAEAVPVMGFYSSFMPEVTRQHVIWFAESGIDFLVTDWSNHIWQKATWDDRDPGSNELIHSTSLAMEVLASMRDEGIPVPKMTLLTGVSYAPNGEVALNGMLNWIYQMYIRNPRFKDLWVELDGKPLILVLDCPGAYYKAGKKLDDRFTIRYNGANHELSHMDQNGFWSWMDGTEAPSVAMVNGKAEALTACIGYFSDGGWKRPTARGRRGGATLLENWRSVLKYRPSFLQVHQFNEFAGQMEGQGSGPNHDGYVDTYSEELSDDFEPTSLTASGYRGNGGWGFHYLNLVRALIDLYRQPVPATTVVIISSPSPREVVKGDSVKVVWDAIGKPAAGYTVQVNGKTVAQGVNEKSATVDLSPFHDGPLTIRVTAENTKSRYLLSSIEDSLPLSEPVAAYAEVGLTLQRGHQ
jgi:hypothetical protein